MEEELHKIKEAGIPVSFDFSDDSTEEYYEKTAPQVLMHFVPLTERPGGRRASEKDHLHGAEACHGLQRSQGLHSL